MGRLTASGMARTRWAAASAMASVAAASAATASVAAGLLVGLAVVVTEAAAGTAAELYGG